MPVSEIPIIDRPPLHDVKRIFLGPCVPGALKHTIQSSWPNLTMHEAPTTFRGFADSDVIVCTEQDSEYLKALKRRHCSNCCLFLGDVASASKIGADACIPVNSRPSACLDQIVFLDSVLKRKKTQSQKSNGVLAKLHSVQRRFDELDRNLGEAEKLQKALSSKQNYSWRNGSLSFRIWSKNAVGGDLMGFFQAGPEHVGFFSIDVVGHGIAPSLFCARIAGLLTGDTANTNISLMTKRGTTAPRSPAAVISNLNALMFDHFETEYYFTATLGFIHCASNTIVLCQAGQTHPIIFGKNSAPKEKQWNGLPVGLVPGAEFQNFRLSAISGDRCFLYSDGISECQNQQGDQYGDCGLVRFLDCHQETAAQILLPDLYKDAQAFGDLQDDACAMVIEFS